MFLLVVDGMVRWFGDVKIHWKTEGLWRGREGRAGNCLGCCLCGVGMYNIVVDCIFVYVYVK